MAKKNFYFTIRERIFVHDLLCAFTDHLIKEGKGVSTFIHLDNFDVKDADMITNLELKLFDSIYE